MILCNPTMPFDFNTPTVDRVVDLQEPTPCSYIITVESPRVCPQNVRCVPNKRRLQAEGGGASVGAAGQPNLSDSQAVAETSSQEQGPGAALTACDERLAAAVLGEAALPLVRGLAATKAAEVAAGQRLRLSLPELAQLALHATPRREAAIKVLSAPDGELAACLGVEAPAMSPLMREALRGLHLVPYDSQLAAKGRSLLLDLYVDIYGFPSCQWSR